VLLALLVRPKAGYHPPRTAFGDPDLQGIWTNSSSTRLGGYPGVNPKISAEEADHILEKKRKKFQGERFQISIPKYLWPTPDEAKRALGKVPDRNRDALFGYDTYWWDSEVPFAKDGDAYRTSWIVDPPNGRVPYLPSAVAEIKQGLLRERKWDNPEERKLGERCLLGFGSSGGPPMLNVEYNSLYQIFQAPGYVVIEAEMIHDARIIPIGGTHLPEGMQPWMGDPVGRWEGDTLVVDTVNLNPKQSLVSENNHLVYLAPGSRITERFTRVSEREIRYEFSVEQPRYYRQTWRAEIPLQAAKGPLYEFACHEGNLSMRNVLSGARYREKFPRSFLHRKGKP
jgi:hypothetical protein